MKKQAQILAAQGAEKHPDSALVLSLFPGVGLLDMAFEAEGFTVVRGPDLLWGGDIRRFHAPAGRFEGFPADRPKGREDHLPALDAAEGKP